MHSFLCINLLKLVPAFFLLNRSIYFFIVPKWIVPNHTQLELKMEVIFQFGDDPYPNLSLCCSIVGGLKYLTITRPNLTFWKSKVCQFMHNPTITYCNVVKQILPNFERLLNHGLHLQHVLYFPISGCSNSDWIGCPNDHRSIIGYSIFPNLNLIHGISRNNELLLGQVRNPHIKLQHMQLLNSIDSTTSIWFTCSATLTAVITVRQNRCYVYCWESSFSCSKKGYPKRFLVRKIVARKYLNIRFLSSVDQLVDITNKRLVSWRFLFLSSKLNGASPNFKLWGRVKDNKNISHI